MELGWANRACRPQDVPAAPWTVAIVFDLLDIALDRSEFAVAADTQSHWDCRRCGCCRSRVLRIGQMLILQRAASD